MTALSCVEWNSVNLVRAQCTENDCLPIVEDGDDLEGSHDPGLVEGLGDVHLEHVVARGWICEVRTMRPSVLLEKD